MARMQFRFAIGDERGIYSASWSVVCTSNSSDVLLFANALGGIQKITVHSPRPGLPNWVIHFRRVADPFSPNGDLNRTLLRSVAPQIAPGLICAAAIYVPSLPPQPLGHNEVKKNTMLCPPPLTGMQAKITVWLQLTDGTPNQWPGKNKGSVLLWSATLSNGAKVYVIREDEPSTSLQIPRELITVTLIKKLFEAPNSRMTVVAQDASGVILLHDFRSAILFLSVPAVLSGRLPRLIRPAASMLIWLFLISSGRVKFNLSALLKRSSFKS